MSNRLKVLLGVGSPKQKKDLRSLIQSQKDMVIVGEVYDPVDILLTVADTEAEVILLDLLDPDVDPGICSHLLIEFPDLLVLALSLDRKQGVLYKQCIIKQEIQAESDDQIICAIRQNA